MRRIGALVLMALTCSGGQALAQGTSPPDFSPLLPPLPGATGTVPLPFDTCADGSSSCPKQVISEMTHRWRPLDRACNHDAVFALTYLRTTEEFERTVTSTPGFFTDTPWVDHEDAVFAQLYFRAYDDYHAGKAVPSAWKIAFDAARSGDVDGIGDLLLAMNAHIQRDLAFTLAHLGLVTAQGASRKADHDRVNAFLDRVIDPLQEELARRYDQLFATTDAEPSRADEDTALEAVRLAREGAWRNAERLVTARSQQQRALVAQSIETYSAATARALVQAFTIPGYRAIRDAHCRAAQRARRRLNRTARSVSRGSR